MLDSLKNLLIFILSLYITPVVSFNIPIQFTRRQFLSNTLALNSLRTSDILLNESNNRESLIKRNARFGLNNIYFTGQLTDETCFKLCETLINYKNQILTNEDFPNHINLYIQSPGGALLPTLALVDEIKNLEVPIHTYVRGYAASAATLLSVVGKERYIYNHSIMMIHSVKLGGDNSINTLLDVKDLNMNVDLFMNIIKDIYLENTNMSEEDLEHFFYHDVWINSKQALEYGLVDKIIK